MMMMMVAMITVVVVSLGFVSEAQIQTVQRNNQGSYQHNTTDLSRKQRHFFFPFQKQVRAFFSFLGQLRACLGGVELRRLGVASFAGAFNSDEANND